jgi:methylated-DNA-[protein]-cysteine S-methyltransferase
MAVAYASLNGPVGWVTVFVEDGAVVALDWGRVETAVAGDGLDAAMAEMERYFDGSPATFTVRVEPEGGAFRQRVWRRLMAIPWGTTASYGALAAELGTSPRAIARACATNPVPIIIPCHRVVASAGGLGGYSGGDGTLTKAALLALEGVGLPLAGQAAGAREPGQEQREEPSWPRPSASTRPGDPRSSATRTSRSARRGPARSA